MADKKNEEKEKNEEEKKKSKEDPQPTTTTTENKNAVAATPAAPGAATAPAATTEGDKKEKNVEKKDGEDKEKTLDTEAGLRMKGLLKNLIILIVVATSGIIAFYTLRLNQAVADIKKTNDKNVQELSNTIIIDESKSFSLGFYTAGQMDYASMNSTKISMESNTINPYNFDLILKLFLKEFQANTFASYYQFGLAENGDYIAVYRLPKLNAISETTPFLVEYKFSKDGKTTCQFCEWSGFQAGRKEHRAVNARDFSVSPAVFAGSRFIDGFNATEQPWFKKVVDELKKPGTTYTGETSLPLPAEALSNNQDVGDGWALPVFKTVNATRSVVGVLVWNRCFDHYNQYVVPSIIAANKLDEKQSITYFITTDGLLIASSDRKPNLKNQGSVKTVRSIIPSESENPLILESFNKLPPLNNIKSSSIYIMGDKKFNVDRINDEGLEYFIVALSETQQFFGTTNIESLAITNGTIVQAVVASILMALIALVTVFVSGFVTTKFIATPLEKLSAGMEKAANFDFSMFSGNRAGQDNKNKSKIRELYLIQATFEKMVKKFAYEIKQNRETFGVKEKGGFSQKAAGFNAKINWEDMP